MTRSSHRLQMWPQMWPQSLYRQILLVAALALLAAQALNAYMLLAGIRSRSGTEAAAMLITRVSNQAERLAERGRAWQDRPAASGRRRKFGIAVRVLSAPLILPQYSVNAEHTLRSNELLGPQSGLSELTVSEGPISALPPDLRDPLLNGASLARMRAAHGTIPTEALLLNARTSDGKWIGAAAFVRPRDRGALAALLLQTLTLYIAVMIPLALVARRIVQPLDRLKERVARVGLADEAAPLQSEGPRDIRDLIDIFNNMQSRVSSLLSEKDVMLGAIGHDLKTPLAALRVRIESVEDDGEREKMAGSIDELVRILDDILTLARLGKSGEALQKTDMAALIDSITDEFEAAGETAAFAPPTGKIIARIRPLLIRRAMRNLVGNAIKHGTEAAISLERDGANLLVHIDDRGPGIAPDQIEQMFAPFARADASRNRATGGSGLGLTIARAIARSHGGDVTLTNRPAGGLRTTLTLPAQI
jgi:signal transduction histidine kinase